MPYHAKYVFLKLFIKLSMPCLQAIESIINKPQTTIQQRLLFGKHFFSGFLKIKYWKIVEKAGFLP